MKREHMKNINEKIYEIFRIERAYKKILIENIYNLWKYWDGVSLNIKYFSIQCLSFDVLINFYISLRIERETCEEVLLLELVSFSCSLKAPAQHVSGDISNKFMFKWGESTWKMAISSHFPPRELLTTETRQTIIICGWLNLFYENKRRRWD